MWHTLEFQFLFVRETALTKRLPDADRFQSADIKDPYEDLQGHCLQTHSLTLDLFVLLSLSLPVKTPARTEMLR